MNIWIKQKYLEHLKCIICYSPLFNFKWDFCSGIVIFYLPEIPEKNESYLFIYTLSLILPMRAILVWHNNNHKTYLKFKTSLLLKCEFTRMSTLGKTRKANLSKKWSFWENVTKFTEKMTKCSPNFSLCMHGQYVHYITHYRRQWPLTRIPLVWK